MAFIFSLAELTVGFDMESYTFSEPDSGVNVRIATVCIAVAESSSQLSIPLTVQPLWRDSSAIGTWLQIFNIVSSCQLD